jgi:hypothetical protein
VTNIDRTARNPNLLWWHRRLWVIDHGAALYFHHGDQAPTIHAETRFSAMREHVLLPFASSITAADARLAPRVTPDLIDAVLAEIPDVWLNGEDRGVYADYLTARLANRGFVEEAEAARG